MREFGKPIKTIKAIALLSLLFTAASGTAQVLDSTKSTTDFSGEWKLDRKASSDSRTLSRFDEVKVSISQDSSSLNVTYSGKRKNKVSVHELKYFTNGRGEENPNPLGGLPRFSKTFWSYGNLVSNYVVVSTVSSTHDQYKQEATDIWELSKDGDTLTIRTEVKEAHLIPEILRWFIKPEKYKKVFRKLNHLSKPIKV